MGKGDKKTRRGKLFSGSYGKLRPRKKNSGSNIVKPADKKQSAPPGKKTEARKPEQAAVVRETIAEKPAEKPAAAAPAEPGSGKVEPGIQPTEAETASRKEKDAPMKQDSAAATAQVKKDEKAEPAEKEAKEEEKSATTEKVLKKEEKKADSASKKVKKEEKADAKSAPEK